MKIETDERDQRVAVMTGPIGRPPGKSEVFAVSYGEKRPGPMVQNMVGIVGLPLEEAQERLTACLMAIEEALRLRRRGEARGRGRTSEQLAVVEARRRKLAEALAVHPDQYGWDDLITAVRDLVASHEAVSADRDQQLLQRRSAEAQVRRLQDEREAVYARADRALRGALREEDGVVLAPTTRTALLEMLADQAHIAWSRWVRSFLSQGVNLAGFDHMGITPENEAQWRRQAGLTYDELTEEEKGSAREVASEFLQAFRMAGARVTGDGPLIRAAQILYNLAAGADRRVLTRVRTLERPSAPFVLMEDINALQHDTTRSWKDLPSEAQESWKFRAIQLLRTLGGEK